MTDVKLPKLLGISGSLRKASNNTALLRGIQSAISSIAVLNIFSLADAPFVCNGIRCFNDCLIA